MPDREWRYWESDADALLRRLDSTRQGLSSAESVRRLRRFGPNRIGAQAPALLPALLLRQFGNPLVMILLAACGLSLALRDWVDSLIVAAIVVCSTLLGVWQEYRASKAVERLRARLALTCRVLRDNQPRVVDATELVPGDVLLLAAGNRVPADARVLEATDCLVSQAAITGESFPVEKSAQPSPPGAPLPARSNVLYLGSSIRSGVARALVVHTGARTEFGLIAERIGRPAGETDFQRGARRFGQLLLRVTLALVLFVLVVDLLRGRPVVDSMLFALALAVGLSPELLPAIVSVTLAAGARDMGRRGVLVKRLEALEDLGGIDVLCTDKTGTLTTGQMALEQACDAQGVGSARVLRLAFVNAALEAGIENPLDEALVRAGEARGLHTRGWRKVAEAPYDFVRRRLSIVVAPTRSPAARRLISKGAVDPVLTICETVRSGARVVPLGPAERQRLQALAQRFGEEGRRVLALATRRLADDDAADRSAERQMTLEGLLVFSDPPREDAADTLRQLREAGIRTLLLTGDNRHVAASLARAVGLDPRAMLTGAQIAAMHEEALWHLAPRTELFVEVDPQQKERIVRALRRTGHRVGFFGDGINDAPALRSADVGISVDSAVDVARESADVVLLDRHLGVLRRGVEDGRRTFANTLKYIAITLSSNFGNMLSMALAAPLLPFLPLAPKQILLNNLLADLPCMAISTDRVDAGLLARPQHWDVADIRRFMLVFGWISSLFDALAFALLLGALDAGETTFQTAWFVLSLFTELVAVMLLRTRGPALASRPGGLLLASGIAVGGVGLALPLLPGLGFAPPAATTLLVMLALLLGYAAVLELAKRRLFPQAAAESRPRG